MIHAKLNNILIEHPRDFPKIEKLVYKIKWQLNAMEIDSKFLGAKLRRGIIVRQALGIIFLFILGLPIFIFGLIHNFLPFQFTSMVMPKLVKEPEYYAPIAILLGIVLYPLSYASFLILAGMFAGLSWWMLVTYFTLMPITGMFAFYFLKFLKQISFKWHYLFLLRGEKALLKSLRSDKIELKSLIFDQ